jgi:hypothetical protein
MAQTQVTLPRIRSRHPSASFFASLRALGLCFYPQTPHHLLRAASHLQAATRKERRFETEKPAETAGFSVFREGGSFS